MANDTVKIVSGASLYNIKNIYNNLIEILTNSGLTNLIANPGMNEQIVNESHEIVVGGWDSNIDISSMPFTMDSTSYYRQKIVHGLELGSTYTASVKVHNTEEATFRIYNDGPISYLSDTWTDEDVIEKIISPTPTGQDYQTVLLTFTVSDMTLPDDIFIEVMGGGTVEHFSSSLHKGLFAFNESGREGFFSHYVRYNTTIPGWEVSKDGGETYDALYTTGPESEETLTNLIESVAFNQTQSDERYLKAEGDEATGEIEFKGGASFSEKLETDASVAPSFGGSDIYLNADSTASFRFTVVRGPSKLPARLIYNEQAAHWYYDNGDGQLRRFGEAGATGFDIAEFQTEIEYFAEILDRSGFKYGYYDTFSSFGQSEDVDPGTDVSYDSEKSYYTIDDILLSGNYLVSPNIMPGDHSTLNIREFFVNVLTDQDDNAGVEVYYSIEDDGAGNPPAPSSTSWNLVLLDDVINAGEQIEQLFLKFVFTEPGIEFHGFGFYYGIWSYNFTTETRLRKIVTVGGSGYTAGQTLTLPDDAAYTADGKSLQVYLNGLRQTRNIDYEEVNPTQVKWLKAVSSGSIIEYFEKYGYADFSEANEVVIQEHKDNTDDAHGSGNLETRLTGNVGFDGTVDAAGELVIQKVPVEVPSGKNLMLKKQAITVPSGIDFKISCTSGNTITQTLSGATEWVELSDYLLTNNVGTQTVTLTFINNTGSAIALQRFDGWDFRIILEDS